MTKKEDFTERPTVLAVASAGGHWQQMMLVIEAFDGANLVLACTNTELGEVYGYPEVIGIRDYNRDAPLQILIGCLEAFRLVRSTRPDLVISTGAAPGLICLLWARLFGARTIWLDSIANTEKLSLSGRLALRITHVVLTQWEHLEQPSKPIFRGRIL